MGIEYSSYTFVKTFHLLQGMGSGLMMIRKILNQFTLSKDWLEQVGVRTIGLDKLATGEISRIYNRPARVFSVDSEGS